MLESALDGWQEAAAWRRALLVLLVTVPTGIAVEWISLAPWFHGSPLEITIVVLFGVLFAWTTFGFCTALIGFVELTRGARYRIASLLASASPILPRAARTAIVMPICNEDAQRVFAGLGAVYRSLARTRQLDRFEFFVLSDTQDPRCWIEEEEAWDALCRSLGRPDAIHYRRRRYRVKRKSGNIAEFLRRHGSRFRYLIVLDADSVMAGSTLVDMVRLMEARPQVGILQSLPFAVGRASLLARAQQFAQRVYGPLFAAGVNYWQLGDAQYWGHNVIIRVVPFMRHCLLPRLPGRAPLGGEVLSHDFVEAALMRRAGYEVWLAPELEGSYEETPPSLLDELKRDRRWCQGNLQHLRLVTAAGVRPLHRLLFVTGALSYISAPLWLLLIALGGVEAASHHDASSPVLLPLLAVTAVMLLLPKVLGALWLVRRRQLEEFAGGGAFAASLVAETLLSMLLAPIRMVFYSRFVAATLLGRTVHWRGQRRDDGGTPWRVALQHHAVPAVAAALVGLALWRTIPGYAVWMLPVLVPLVFAPFISVATSRADLGRRGREAGLFVVGEERRPPRELVWLHRGLHVYHAARSRYTGALADPCMRALLHPRVHALHLSLLPARKTDPLAAARYAPLRRRLLNEGLDALSDRERLRLLSDAFSVALLHEELWCAEVPVWTQPPVVDTAPAAAAEIA